MDAIRQINRKKSLSGVPSTPFFSSLRFLTHGCLEAGRCITNTPIPTLPPQHPLHHTAGARHWRRGGIGSQPYWRGAAKHPSRCQGFSKPWQCQGEQQGSHKEHITQQASPTSSSATGANSLSDSGQGPLEEFVPSHQSPLLDAASWGQQQKAGVANNL